jgi:hypothetical protein
MQLRNTELPPFHLGRLRNYTVLFTPPPLRELNTAFLNAGVEIFVLHEDETLGLNFISFGEAKCLACSAPLLSQKGSVDSKKDLPPLPVRRLEKCPNDEIIHATMLHFLEEISRMQRFDLCKTFTIPNVTLVETVYYSFDGMKEFMVSFSRID